MARESPEASPANGSMPGCAKSVLKDKFCSDFDTGIGGLAARDKKSPPSHKGPAARKV